MKQNFSLWVAPRISGSKQCPIAQWYHGVLLRTDVDTFSKEPSAELGFCCPFESSDVRRNGYDWLRKTV